jgi:hypothetical protein
MLATAIALAILWFVADMLGALLRQNAGKIRAALAGSSYSAQFEPAARSSSRRATEPAPSVLRAAA